MRNFVKELPISIIDGNIDNVAELLDQGAPMIVGHFIIATEMRLYDILDLFLSRGWDINTEVDRLRSSALVYAFDDVTLLTWFLEHGADPNKRSQIRNCTRLSWAVARASFEAIEILFRYGGLADQGQLLHYAAKRGQPDSLKVMRFIYDKNLEANAMNVNKLLDQDPPHDFAMNFRACLGTPLHFAALTGSLDCVEFLVKKGGDPWILDPYRRNALSLANYAKHRQVVRFLKGLGDSVVSEQEQG